MNIHLNPSIHVNHLHRPQRPNQRLDHVCIVAQWIQILGYWRLGRDHLRKGV